MGHRWLWVGFRSALLLGCFAGQAAEAANLDAAPDMCRTILSAGPLAETTIPDEGRPRYVPAKAEPAVDVRFRYPISYMRNPEQAPASPERASGVQFWMHVSDGSPIAPEEVQPAPRTFIPPNKRQPYVAFLLSDRFEIQTAASLLLRAHTGQSVTADLPSMSLAPSPFPGLQEVTNERSPKAWKTRSFVAFKDGRFSAYLKCHDERSVPNPQCNLYFDHGMINVDAYFMIRSLPEWQAIVQRIGDFIDCTHVSDTPVRADGKPTWE